MSIDKEIPQIPSNLIDEVVFDNPSIEIHFSEGYTLKITADSQEEWSEMAAEMIKSLPIGKIRM